MPFVRALIRATRTHGRNLVLWLSLASFCVTAGGMPVAAAPQFGGGMAYPCQGNRCGCRTASECWNGCCCMTMAEKLAWARKHNVTPPDYAIAAAAREAKPAAGGCCAAKAARPACCARPAACPNGNCDEVPAYQAPRCRGAAQEWLSLGALAPSPDFNSAPRDAIACGTVSLVDELLLSIVSRPDAPPPRSA